jgi:hypothetical protein
MADQSSEGMTKSWLEKLTFDIKDGRVRLIAPDGINYGILVTMLYQDDWMTPDELQTLLRMLPSNFVEGAFQHLLAHEDKRKKGVRR